jgi:hypothetical protein
MLPKFAKIGYPLGKFRLITFILTALSVGILLALASTNLKWFTTTRQLYLLFGVTAGLLFGLFEAKTVIPKLLENTETYVWTVLPIGIALFSFPWLFVTQIIGASEYLPYGLYAFFPFITAVLGSSGWYFNKFEKEKEVMLFVFVYGVHYWKEQNPNIIDRFYYFIRDLVSKDLSSLYLHIGYSGLYIKELGKKENIDSSTKQVLQQILNVMKKFRRVGLSIYAAFMIAMPLLILWLYILTSTHTFGMQQVVAHRIVSGREITIVLGITPVIAIFGGVFGALWYVRNKFKRTISSLLASVDSDKLSSVV